LQSGKERAIIRPSKPDITPDRSWRNPMKALILAVVVAVGLGAGISHANADSQSYRTPAHNYYQNNWMSR
jgi:hypothetical protein